VGSPLIMKQRSPSELRPRSCSALLLLLANDEDQPPMRVPGGQIFSAPAIIGRDNLLRIADPRPQMNSPSSREPKNGVHGVHVFDER